MAMLETLLADGRAAAEALMQDQATITRGGGGEPVFDPATGTYTTPVATVVYSGKCRVQVSDGLNAANPEAGGEVLTVARLTLQVPVVGTEGVEVDDVVTITVATHDPALVDREFRVVSTFAKTHPTARRLHVEETS